MQLKAEEVLVKDVVLLPCRAYFQMLPPVVTLGYESFFGLSTFRLGPSQIRHLPHTTAVFAVDPVPLEDATPGERQ